ncbi:hypothetical protein BH10BAC2_BH10BAC2_34770 [soil metagenome]
MKSPSLLQTVDTLDFNLLTRSSVKENFQQSGVKKFRRRASRKNLAIITLIYGAFLACMLLLMF